MTERTGGQTSRRIENFLVKALAPTHVADVVREIEGREPTPVFFRRASLAFDALAVAAYAQSQSPAKAVALHAAAKGVEYLGRGVRYIGEHADEIFKDLGKGGGMTGRGGY